jgi:hypothetical protein
MVNSVDPLLKNHAIARKRRAEDAEILQNGDMSGMTSDTLIKAGVCVWTLSGRITPGELRAGYLKRFTTHGWRPEMDSLTILDRADLSEMTPELTRDFIDFIQAIHPGHENIAAGRSAIVCNDELATALLAYFQHSGEGDLRHEQRAFSSRCEAEAWLFGSCLCEAA